MFEKVEELTEEIKASVAESQEELELYRLRFISKKGELASLFQQLKDIPNDRKREFGQAVNQIKKLAQDRFKELIGHLDNNQSSEQFSNLDLTLPAEDPIGSIHPITATRNRIIEIFKRIGFNVSDGPEIEDDWHNFTALNFPPNHPAREMQDTFFIEKNPDMVLRTHTSNVQVRLMQSQKPPFRSIMPGRVFRNEAISARAHCIFHQVEGLYVAENVSFKDLKETLYYFAKEMFGKETNIRFRPSYFPFTEPSAEMDISCDLLKPGTCKLCGGTKNICKGTGWVEILGCGMVDPNVLESCGIDSNKYTGFAFGMGIERIAMLKYQIKDLRLFTENDIRFLSQFKTEV